MAANVKQYFKTKQPRDLENNKKQNNDHTETQPNPYFKNQNNHIKNNHRNVYPT